MYIFSYNLSCQQKYGIRIKVSRDIDLTIKLVLIIEINFQILYKLDDLNVTGYMRYDLY